MLTFNKLLLNIKKYIMNSDTTFKELKVDNWLIKNLVTVAIKEPTKI